MKAAVVTKSTHVFTYFLPVQIQLQWWMLILNNAKDSENEVSI